MRFGRKYLWAANAVGLRLRGVKIAFPSFVGPTMFILGRRNIKIGKNVRIWPGLRVEVFNGATLTIEDHVAIGANCHITVGADMTIGAGSIFTGANVITNITHELSEMHKSACDRPWKMTDVHIGKNVFAGHGAKIMPGTRLADGCVVGANAVVSNLTAPENAVVVGMPAIVKRIVS